jgi:hypothetical protein
MVKKRKVEEMHLEISLPKMPSGEQENLKPRYAGPPHPVFGRKIPSITETPCSICKVHVPTVTHTPYLHLPLLIFGCFCLFVCLFCGFFILIFFSLQTKNKKLQHYDSITAV